MEPVSGKELPFLALGSGSSDIRELAPAYLAEYVDKIRLACEGLSRDQIWQRSTPASNSIGNLMLHLTGNLSLWIGEGLGGTNYERDRAGEFSARDTTDWPHLFGGLENVVADCRAIASGVSTDDLRRVSSIQGYEVSGQEALFHAVEHMSYHTGQIVMMAKAMRHLMGSELEFYPHHRGEGADSDSSR